MQQTLEQRNHEKHNLLRFMLPNTKSVFVHLDTRVKGVLIPSRLYAQTHVVLQVGLDMPVPIPDLNLDADGVRATLSFKGVPFTCFVPWTSVFALVNEDTKGLIWHEDMPAGLAQASASEVSESAKTSQYLRPVNKAAARVGWGVIDGGKVDDASKKDATGHGPFSS